MMKNVLRLAVCVTIVMLGAMSAKAGRGELPGANAGAGIPEHAGAMPGPSPATVRCRFRGRNRAIPGAATGWISIARGA